MVKNTNGGSGHKKQARSKMSNAPANRVLRLQKEEGENYACVTKIFGGDRCLVLGLDNKPRNCIIRGKFRGNNKRKGFLRIGTIVLIGGREWQSQSKSEMETCDLLEVYADYEVDELKSRVHANWGLFSRYLENIAAGADMEEARAEADRRHDDPMTFAFMSESAEEYMELMQRTREHKSSCLDGEDLISSSSSSMSILSEEKETPFSSAHSQKEKEKKHGISSFSFFSSSHAAPSPSPSPSSSSPSLSEEELLAQDVKLEFNENGKVNFDFI